MGWVGVRESPWAAIAQRMSGQSNFRPETGGGQSVGMGLPARLWASRPADPGSQPWVEPTEVLQAGGLDGEGGQLQVSGHLSEASRRGSSVRVAQAAGGHTICCRDPKCSLAFWGRGKAYLAPSSPSAKPRGARGAPVGPWG